MTTVLKKCQVNFNHYLEFIITIKIMANSKCFLLSKQCMQKNYPSALVVHKAFGVIV